MPEIPEDVMQEGTNIAATTLDLKDSRHDALADKIARAILAERERCAEVAERRGSMFVSQIVCDQVAAAIRGEPAARRIEGGYRGSGEAPSTPPSGGSVGRRPSHVEPLKEGMVRKGGINRGSSQVTSRPPPPSYMRKESP